MPAARPLVSAPLAGCCSLFSVFGAIVLAVIGWGFDHDWESFMGSTHDPKDGHAVAQTCYVAALVYAAFIVFCCCQLGVHRRYSRIQL